MKARLVSAVVIAVVCAGLTSCSALGSNSPTAASSSTLGGSAAPDSSGSALDSPPDSPSATATATPMSSVTARPSPTTHHSATAHASPTASKSAKPKSSPSSGSSGSGSFTVPGIPGENVLSAYGSYTKINSARVKVTICVKQLAKAFAVGAEAVVYNSSGASQNVGAIVLSGSGQTSDCSTLTFLLYTAHLKVHTYIGNNGAITKTGPVKTIY